MEELFLSRALSPEQLQLFLQANMPAVTAFAWAVTKHEDMPVGFKEDTGLHILFESEPDINLCPGFTCRLTLYRTPSENYQERALWLGQMLSADYGVNVLAAFSHPDHPKDPYYNILFQNGVSYLADDSETQFGESDAKPVRILEPYMLPHYRFDSAGHFTGLYQ